MAQVEASGFKVYGSGFGTSVGQQEVDGVNGDFLGWRLIKKPSTALDVQTPPERVAIW